MVLIKQTHCSTYPSSTVQSQQLISLFTVEATMRPFLHVNLKQSKSKVCMVNIKQNTYLSAMLSSVRLSNIQVMSYLKRTKSKHAQYTIIDKILKQLYASQLCVFFHFTHHRLTTGDHKRVHTFFVLLKYCCIKLTLMITNRQIFAIDLSIKLYNKNPKQFSVIIFY